MRPLTLVSLVMLCAADLGVSLAQEYPEPQLGCFSCTLREAGQARPEPGDVDRTDCVVSSDATSLDARRAGYVDLDTAHYARGSVLNVIVFVNHGDAEAQYVWDAAEREEAGCKAAEAKRFYLEHMPPIGFITFDNENEDCFFYYEVTLPYDINDLAGAEGFEKWMVTDAAEALGFINQGTDGSVIDDMTIWLQDWGGGWDNVIVSFMPADYNFRARASTSAAYIRIDQYEEWGVWAHEWGHVFGACDEYSDWNDDVGALTCDDDINCNDVCQGGYLIVDDADIFNGNCDLCEGSTECIMRSGRTEYDHPPCMYTYQNWAWVDENGNDLLDKTRGWDPFAGAVYEIFELAHNEAKINTDTDRGYVANQRWTSWSTIAVRSGAGADHSIAIYGENNRNHNLAWSVGHAGIEFVVGDFNHNNRGQDHVMLVGHGEYELLYEAGNQMLFPDGVERNRTWNADDVVRTYDVPLFKDEYIVFILENNTPGLDLGMALFGSNGDTYYAGRASALWEADANGAGLSEFEGLSVPRDDVYGLVVWSNTPAGGDFSITVGPSIRTLDEKDPTASEDLALYEFTPSAGYWAVMAARPGESSNLKLSLFEESTFETRLATSGAYPNVEFIAADYGGGASTDYLRVLRQSGTSFAWTEWEQGDEILGGWYNDTWSAGDICRVWDAHLRGGETYRFQQYGDVFSPVNVGIYVLSSADGDPYKQRSAAEAGSNGTSALGEWFTFTAPTDDWYGAVMIGNDESSGWYDMGVGPQVSLVEQAPYEAPDEIIWIDATTVAASWASLGVRAGAGAESSLTLWTCENCDLLCFEELETEDVGPRYIVIDANHEPAATYFARADRRVGTAAQAVSFDVASPSDIVLSDPTEIETTDGSFSVGEVVQIWDLDLMVAPLSVAIEVEPLDPSLDVGVALFGSAGGSTVQSSDGAIESADRLGPGGTEVISFSQANDVYGVVITNQNGAPGAYRIRVGDADIIDVASVELPWTLGFRLVDASARRFVVDLPEAMKVSLDVFDVRGRRVRTLVDEDLGAGRHAVAWDGAARDGSRIGAGVYFARLTAAEDVLTLKVCLPR